MPAVKVVFHQVKRKSFFHEFVIFVGADGGAQIFSDNVLVQSLAGVAGLKLNTLLASIDFIGNERSITQYELVGPLQIARLRSCHERLDLHLILLG